MEDGDVSFQVVLVDTPGLHRPRTELGNRLNTLVYRSLPEADVIVFTIDATQSIGPGDRLVAERLADVRNKTIVVVNKTDIAKADQIAEQLLEAGMWDFAGYVPISASTGENLEPLMDEIVIRLPEGPLYFPPDTTTDQPDHLLAAEIVREKFLDRLRDELPHSLYVFVEDIAVTEDGLTVIRGRLIVERKSQKGIVIGKGGSMLSAGGTDARHELESMFGTKVHLDLRVAVEKNWQESPQILDRFGFSS